MNAIRRLRARCGGFLKALTVSADELLVFDDDGQVPCSLVETEQDYTQLIKPGVDCGRHGMQVVEAGGSRLTRQYYVTDRIIAEVVDPLIAVHPLNSLEQTQCVAVQSESRVTTV
jgi:hypothetical protein